MSTQGIDPFSGASSDSTDAESLQGKMDNIADTIARMTAGGAVAPGRVNPSGLPLSIDTTNLFFQTLMDSLRDGVIFIDAQCEIQTWSQSVEVLTGMSSSRMVGTNLKPGVFGLTDSIGSEVKEIECPFGKCVRTGKPSHGEFKIVGRSGREIKVEVTCTPVSGADGIVYGAVVQIHDASIQTDLQRQLKDLYEFSVMDPLTQVANRAEFERVLGEYVKTHHTSDFICSIIICDIDFFKQINDNYGHHIGDQALIAFAQLLKKFVRAQDVVARYGGEEFVILCADCDVDSAVQRAEEIRATLTSTPQQMLNGKCITASFGVSELQKNETSTEFFVRADHALLNAKETGRNRVVKASELINGKSRLTSAEPTSISGVSWRKIKGSKLTEEEFSTQTPMSVLIEKLRGYILEAEAKVDKVDEEHALIRVQHESPFQAGEKGSFLVDIEFQESEADPDNNLIGDRRMTFIRISIRAAKSGWFGKNTTDLYPQVMSDIRRYLMINDDSSRVKITPAATKPGKR